ncbi:MAG: glycosyltransferase family 2 protein [Duncaniella sp.]|nr:glycosyltransferase family 2 protein [Duncaniella sp.]
METPTLTIFTPTFNRAHLLRRVYESLVTQSCRDFEWLVVDDGSTDFTRSLVESFIREGRIPVRYIYKENGGLHTAYNTAYAEISAELCVCIDSDDFMPEDAVEIIVNTWREKGSDKYAGLIGLDCRLDTMEPIGGPFPEGLTECYFLDLKTKGIHHGDSKQVMRTELMKQVAPQIGFEGEKNFNPVYMLLQVCDTRPLLVVNECLCIVDYQNDGFSMSANIFRQYIDSPRSFAKLRRLEMTLQRSTFVNSARCAVHYVSSCLIAGDKDWLSNSPRKLLTLAAYPAGWLLSKYILRKSSRC